MTTNFSPVIAGTMSWGNWDKNLGTREMADLLNICVASGITTFDHADIYGGYTTEAEFGKAFAESGIARDQIQLISKCGIEHTSGRDNAVKHYNYSKEYIIRSAENSLDNLQTDYLDALLLHRPSPLMQADEIAEAVTILRSESKIKGFGVSNFTPSQTDLIRQNIDVGYNQIQFSATHFEPMLDGTLDHMQLHGITPMAWNPLGSVFREETDHSRRLKMLLSDLAGKYNAAPDIILLAWIIRHPAGIIPVAGTANPNRIRELMKAVEIELDLVDWFSVWTESMGEKVP